MWERFMVEWDKVGNMARDDIATIESESEYTVPTGSLYDLDAIPAFAGSGWQRAAYETDTGRETVKLTVRDEDRGLQFSFEQYGYDAGPLDELPDHNPQHIKQRSEKGNSGHGHTLLAGDFYIDWRRDGRNWTGMDWEGGYVEGRVRRRPETPERTTIVADAVDVIGRRADSKGRVTLGSDYAGEDVKVAILATDE